MQMHRKPLVGVWGGRLIYHRDERQPFCGHMQFLSRYGSQGRNEFYKEGTYDNRTVSAYHR